MAKPSKKEARIRRHRSIRHRVRGTKDRPRLCVWTSNKHLRAQLVDDSEGRILLSVSTYEKPMREAGCRANIAGGAEVGKLIAERARDQKVTTVVFDRGGFRYHGVVKAVAEAAREGGLIF